MLLCLPVGMVFVKAFGKGVAPAWESVTTPAALHAFWLTILVVAIAVPANTVFGLLTAWLIERKRFPGRRVLDAIIDLPFAVSPVVIGLALILVWGQDGWLGSGLRSACRSSSPCPAWSWRRSSSRCPSSSARSCRSCGRWAPTRSRPPRRWARRPADVLAHHAAGDPLGAGLRRHAHHGAGAGRVRRRQSIVSGKIAGRTETLTLHVEERFQNFDVAGAYAAAVVLALLAISVLLAMTLVQRRSEAR